MKNKMEIMVKTKATSITKRTWCPMPMIMGIGPIMIMPPKVAVSKDKKIEIIMRIMPRRINRKPRKNILICFSSVALDTFSP